VKDVHDRPRIIKKRIYYESFESFEVCLMDPEYFSTLTIGYCCPSLDLNPKICPISPDGFGTGHSLALSLLAKF